MSLLPYSQERSRNLRWTKWGALAVALAFVLTGSATPAHANLVITATFDSSISSDPNASAIEGTINQAIQFYENTFSNSINIGIEFYSMNSGLGESTWPYQSISYSSFRSALAGEPTDSTKSTALNNLPKQTNNPVTDSSSLSIKSANMLALGMSTSAYKFSDGYTGYGEIGLNTSITFPPNSKSGNYSLLAVTEHEIDEVLGLGSALNLPSNSAPLPEDLYRYSASGTRSLTSSGSATSYFSIDGGTTNLSYFNQDSSGDYGDWESNPLPSSAQPQVQDAFGTPGSSPYLTINSPEVVALDAIGYDVVPVPEPGSFVLLGGTALFMTGIGWWRRRRSVAVPAG